MSSMSRLPSVLPLNTFEIGMNMIFVPACAHNWAVFLNAKVWGISNWQRINEGISSWDDVCAWAVTHSVWMTEMTSGHSVQCSVTRGAKHLIELCWAPPWQEPCWGVGALVYSDREGWRNLLRRCQINYERLKFALQMKRRINKWKTGADIS